MRQVFVVAVCAIACIPLLTEPASAQTRDTARKESPRDMTPQIRSIVDDELGAKLKPQFEKLRDELQKQLAAKQEKSEEKTSEQVLLIVHLMEAFLGVVTVIFGILAAAGFMEIRRVRQLRLEASQDLEEAKKAASQSAEALRVANSASDTAHSHSQRIGQMRENIESAWIKINEHADGLPRPKNRELLGQPESISKEVRIAYEDADILIFVSDQLGTGTAPDRLSAALIKIAWYWRAVGEYQRAVVRMRRASALSPNAYEVRRSLGSALMEWAAADDSVTPQRKRVLLADAEAELDRARELKGGVDAILQHEYGWLYDEMGDWDKAISDYEIAIKLDREEATRYDREPEYDYTYDLSCALAKKGDFERALTALSGVIDKSGLWLQVESDPDFERMLKDADWGPRLRELIADTKHRLELGG